MAEKKDRRRELKTAQPLEAHREGSRFLSSLVDEAGIEPPSWAGRLETADPR